MRIAILAGQLVGYWGSDDRTSILASLLAAPIQSLSATPVGISASGLGLDCWVRLPADADLVLGREPFGRTPLYWLECDRTIWFASHLQLLLPIAPPPAIDVGGLYGYSCFSYVPTPLTPVKGIQAVPAGTELHWQAGKLERTNLVTKWQQAQAQITDETVAVKQLQGLLQAAIHRQIQDLPAEPVGVLLSGGLDSSIAAALLVQNEIGRAHV